MSAPRFAPKENGLAAYVVTSHSWGQQHDRIEWAANLAEAKRHHGWTRQLHTSVTVRRATSDDIGRITRADQ